MRKELSGCSVADVVPGTTVHALVCQRTTLTQGNLLCACVYQGNLFLYQISVTGEFTASLQLHMPVYL